MKTELKDKDEVSSKLEKAWVAYVSPDDRRSVVYGYYDSYFLAEQDVIGKSWYGSSGTVSREPIEVITLEFADGTSSSFEMKKGFEIRTESEEDRKARKEKARQAALAKLTPAEREVLGL